jgi:hypothetical protein
LTFAGASGQKADAEWGISAKGGFMKRSATGLAVFAGILLTAEAPVPHETGLDVPTAQSGDVLISCIRKKMSGNIVREVPIEGGGVSIQSIKYPNSPFFGHPTLNFDITETDGTRHIVVNYRHPMSKEGAAKWTRIVGRKCFPYELEAAGGGRLPAGTD